MAAHLLLQLQMMGRACKAQVCLTRRSREIMLETCILPFPLLRLGLSHGSWGDIPVLICTEVGQG